MQIDQAADRFRTAHQSRRDELIRLRQVFVPDFDCAMLAEACATAAGDASLRWNGALFRPEEIITQTIPCGTEPECYALLASDGSQIMPDRHRPVLFALIQIACACVAYGCNGSHSPELEAALEFAGEKDTRLLSEDELFRPDLDDIMSAGEIAAERDLREIEVLAERCEAFDRAGVQAVALADGALVPFSLLNDMRLRPDDRRLARFKAALGRLKQSKAIVAGYIARPSSNAIVRACALAGVPAHEVAGGLRRGEYRPHLVVDRHLLETVIPRYHRSACFTPNWTINAAEYLGRDGHTMRAIYLNVGPDKPEIARVEMPAWCADIASLDILTGILARHCRMGCGYPLCLKAAHEEAVLTRQDQREIESRLQLELQRTGMISTPSPKQESKDRH